MPNQYNMKATVDITVEAETPAEARKAAFDLITSAKTVAKRGRNAGAAPKASVTGVTIDESGRHEPRQCCVNVSVPGEVERGRLQMKPSEAWVVKDDDVVPVSGTADAMESKTSV
jgi:hypothetical protein